MVQKDPESQIKAWVGTVTHFRRSHLHVLEIKKICQRIVNYVNPSVLKLETRYLHQNGEEFNQIGNIFKGLCRQKPNKIQQK